MAYKLKFESKDSMSTPTLLQREIWEKVVEILAQYAPDFPELWTFIRELTDHAFKERNFRLQNDTFVFDFGDDTPSRYLNHVFERLVSAEYETLQRRADHHGVKLQEVPSLADVLGEPIDRFGKDLEPRASGEECECPLCVRLRPDAAFEDRWIEAKASPQVRDFILRSANPSTNLLVALAASADTSSSYRLRRSMYSLGKRLDPSRFESLVTRAKDADSSQVQAGLVAVLAGIDVDPHVRVDALEVFFDADAPVAETAVEFLGYGAPPRHASELAEKLSDCVGRYQSLDDAIALTLYNLFRGGDAPADAIAALRVLRTTSGEAGDIAGRALEWFGR